MCLALPSSPLAAEGWPRIRKVRADIDNYGYIFCLDVYYSNQDRAVRLGHENSDPLHTIVFEVGSDDEHIVGADSFNEHGGTFRGFRVWINPPVANTIRNGLEPTS